MIVRASAASAEVEAVNEGRTADNVLQVMPVQTITNLPCSNLGDAIGCLPSVSLTRNEGEDHFVQIRGTEPRLNNTSVDGLNMSSENPGVNEFDFSAIPMGIVDSIVISKTLQPNMDGDWIGGSVNLATKTASDKPTYQISVLEATHQSKTAVPARMITAPGPVAEPARRSASSSVANTRGGYGYQ